MNILVFSISIGLIVLQIGFAIKYIVIWELKQDLKYCIIAVLLLITSFISISGLLNYLGYTDNYIKQGVFYNNSVQYPETVIEYNPPLLKRKTKSDRELYEEQVKRLYQ